MFLPLTLVTQEHLIPRTCSIVCTSKVDTFDMDTDFSFASAIPCMKRCEVPTATNANTSSFFSFKVPGSHFKKLQILTPGSTGSYITVSVRVQPFFCVLQFLPVCEHGGVTEIIIESVLSALLLFTNGELFFWLSL